MVGHVDETAVGIKPLFWLDCENGLTSEKFLDALRVVYPEVVNDTLVATVIEQYPDHTSSGAMTRSYREVRRILDECADSEYVRYEAHAVFSAIADAEAVAHDTNIVDIHFHEIGRIANVARVMGIFTALEELGAREWFASPLVLGRGTVRCSHGKLSVPTPATQYIVDRFDLPEASASRITDGEWTTPTGAALATRAKRFMLAPPPDTPTLRTLRGRSRKK
ncbi:MAG: LarC family nickel insertion protein [Coriobacteriia bacterium]|nr:LarC family nickel insertion protein [Coriobacteriia bacterium]